MLRVKICGITNAEDASLCCDCGADALGLIFYRKSSRSVSVSGAKKIVEAIGPFVATVGVFVDEKEEVVKEIASQLKLTALQFHGNESPRFCLSFRKEYRVIKTFFPHRQDIQAECRRYKVDAYLFDMTQEAKISGKKRIASDQLKKISRIGQSIRVIISGGLTPGNVSSVLALNSLYGVDVASGTESVPGKKDPDLVKKFIQKVKIYERTRR